jgi:hypothetical protein
MANGEVFIKTESKLKINGGKIYILFIRDLGLDKFEYLYIIMKIKEVIYASVIFIRLKANRAIYTVF